jgi:hypothetical protein
MKYKVSEYLPGIGYFIEKFSGKDKIDHFSCAVHFNVPCGIPATEEDIKIESKIIADEVCRALNAYKVKPKKSK